MAFGIAVVLVSLFHLFTVTWSSANAHIRAREMLFHSTAYLDGPRANYAESSSSPFNPDQRQYEKAEPGASIEFSGRAWDTTRDDLIGPDDISVTMEMVN
ncbi:MAG: hypothetical protein GY913_04180 [Proteobacteria bacterium]|nr:hypothetical protein [Pseudomonadota bacterium]MCP4916101.1 hypothetical protein [Pseudomonadota bacterium]